MSIPYHGPDRRRHGFRRWVDWRLIASLGFILLVLLVFYAVWSSAVARDQAFDSLAASRAAASRRIDLLTAEIHDLQGSSEHNGALIAQLQAQVGALREQLIKAGIQPVVPAAEETPTPSPTPGGSAKPKPHPKPHPKPSTKRPEPTPTCVAPLLVCP